MGDDTRHSVTDLTDEERQFLVGLLERRLDGLLHELHHASTRQFREALKNEAAMTERLLERVRVPTGVA
jgi:hypothetical protein